jgi:hypothetical protein
MRSEEGRGNANVAIAASMHSWTRPRAASGCQNQPSAKEAVLLPLLSSFRLYARSAHFCNALSGIRPHLPAPMRHRVPILDEGMMKEELTLEIREPTKFRANTQGTFLPAIEGRGGEVGVGSG